MTGPFTADELTRMSALPCFSRAREFHLYTGDGQRWLDCWAGGGLAVAGHRPRGVSKRLKNEIDRGLFTAYPNKWERRLVTALKKVFPGYTEVRFYSSPEAAQTALKLTHAPEDPLDLPPGASASVLWGRPLLPDSAQADVLFPLLPMGLSNLQPVMFRDGGPEYAPSQPASGVILAGLTRSCAALKEVSRPVLNADIWKVRGPYMLFQGTNQEYGRFFESMCSRRILIAPSADRPSVLPQSLSEPETALLSGKGV